MKSARLGRMISITLVLAAILGKGCLPDPNQRYVTFSAPKVYVSEGESKVVVMVKLTIPSDDPVTVEYTTKDGSATSQDDYFTKSDTLIFEPGGDLVLPIEITLKGDNIPESLEYAYVELSNASANAQIWAGTCQFYIIDDDNPPPTVQFEFSTYDVNESDGTITLNVQLSDYSPIPVTVNVASNPGTGDAGAKDGSDFVSLSTSLRFELGEVSKSISVTINPEGTVEPDETFTVKLDSPSGATLGTPATATVTIKDSDTLSVSASSSVTPSVVLPNMEATAQLTASANIEPNATYEPTWNWSFTIEYAETAGAWGPPPQDAQFSITIDAAPSTNPSGTQLRASFSKVGYWRISQLSAGLTYVGRNGSCSVNDVEILVVKVELAPSPAYVQTGGTAILTATVTPPEGGTQISYSSDSVSVATVLEDPAYPTVIGVGAGDTKINAVVAGMTAATVDLSVFDVSYSPQSGPIYTKATFSIDTPGVTFFSANTSIRIDAIFSPAEFEQEWFSVTHDPSKLSFDEQMPNKISLAVADVFPDSFLSSSNPGVVATLPGNVAGLVTIIDGAKQITVEAQFNLAPAGKIGVLSEGVFVESDANHWVWKASSSDDLLGSDPLIHMHAQIVRPINEFTASPPSTITAKLQSFREDGSTVGSGVVVQFNLTGSDSSNYYYQNTKPFVLIDNASLEGEWPELIAIVGEGSSSLQMVRLP